MSATDAPAPSGPVFEVDDLSFRYRGALEDSLCGISLGVPAGQAVCIIGPNGAGKSTLLYQLGLLADPPQQGKIRYLPVGGSAIDYTALPQAARAALRRTFGFALQRPYLMPQLTCAENVAMPLLLLGVPRGEALTRARERLAALGAEAAGLADRQGGSALSGGQEQMMTLLRAVIHDPPVVFADEPVASADAARAERLLGLLIDWQRGGTGRSLLMVMHDLERAARLGDSFILLGADHRARGGRVFPRDELEMESRADRTDLASRLARWVREGR